MGSQVASEREDMEARSRAALYALIADLQRQAKELRRRKDALRRKLTNRSWLAEARKKGARRRGEGAGEGR